MSLLIHSKPKWNLVKDMLPEVGKEVQCRIMDSITLVETATLSEDQYHWIIQPHFGSGMLLISNEDTWRYA